MTVAPVLCTVGVLAHECRCEEGAVCDHETGCEVDPCADQIFRRDESASELTAVGDQVLAVASMPPRTLAGAWSGLPVPAAPLDPAPLPGAPHASDLPLLS